jgi:hypothetical protein
MRSRCQGFGGGAEATVVAEITGKRSAPTQMARRILLIANQANDEEIREVKKRKEVLLL